MGVRSPENIKLELNRLIQEAQPVFPNLASRLGEMWRWIAEKKNGLLRSKRPVMLLLTELVDDTDFWLAMQLLPENDRDALLDTLSPSEQYWYNFLFPAWFNEPDPKQKNWQRNLMGDKFQGNDATLINNICNEIEKLGGTIHNPYIADLSMATDLIASGAKQLPLCVQITTMHHQLTTNKEGAWLATLSYWKIPQGLFVSFNPTLEQAKKSVGKCIYQYSDQSPKGCYRIINIDRQGLYVHQLRSN